MPRRFVLGCDSGSDAIRGPPVAGSPAPPGRDTSCTCAAGCGAVPTQYLVVAAGLATARPLSRPPRSMRACRGARPLGVLVRTRTGSLARLLARSRQQMLRRLFRGRVSGPEGPASTASHRSDAALADAGAPPCDAAAALRCLGACRGRTAMPATPEGPVRLGSSYRRASIPYTGGSAGASPGRDGSGRPKTSA